MPGRFAIPMPLGNSGIGAHLASRRRLHLRRMHQVQARPVAATLRKNRARRGGCLDVRPPNGSHPRLFIAPLD
jgi:hypothetical protein